ncbi:hypothetical protein AKJ16_DCAP08360 [Drosera capensis]
MEGDLNHVHVCQNDHHAVAAGETDHHAVVAGSGCTFLADNIKVHLNLSETWFDFYNGYEDFVYVHEISFYRIEPHRPLLVVYHLNSLLYEMSVSIFLGRRSVVVVPKGSQSSKYRQKRNRHLIDDTEVDSTSHNNPSHCSKKARWLNLCVDHSLPLCTNDVTEETQGSMMLMRKKMRDEL